MRTKNHLKAKSPQGYSLRGIGKLGWTESGTMFSTQKRLLASLVTEDTEVRIKKKPLKKKCPKCGRRIKVINGKLSPHRSSHFFYALPNWGTKICK